jgi:hypothetical protein
MEILVMTIFVGIVLCTLFTLMHPFSHVKIGGGPQIILVTPLFDMDARPIMERFSSLIVPRAPSSPIAFGCAGDYDPT